MKRGKFNKRSYKGGKRGYKGGAGKFHKKGPSKKIRSISISRGGIRL